MYMYEGTDFVYNTYISGENRGNSVVSLGSYDRIYICVYTVGCIHRGVETGHSLTYMLLRLRWFITRASKRGRAQWFKICCVCSSLPVTMLPTVRSAGVLTLESGFERSFTKRPMSPSTFVSSKRQKREKGGLNCKKKEPRIAEPFGLHTIHSSHFFYHSQSLCLSDTYTKHIIYIISISIKVNQKTHLGPWDI